MTGICPYAKGYDPFDFTCDLAVAEDAGLPWWRRLARALVGRYDCPYSGYLQIGVTGSPIPCERFGMSRLLPKKEDRA